MADEASSSSHSNSSWKKFMADEASSSSSHSNSTRKKFMACEASSSSHSNSIRKKFHVFISFRGEDTRKTFTSHLYSAFSDKKINAYIDEESLKKGDEISPTLLEAIEESMISVVILSKDYASSRWCLDELNLIVQCKESHNQIVVPVFYDIDPSDVRKQQGSYSSAFAAHEERFKDQIDKVHQWRNSLTKVADLSGFHSSNFRSDSTLVEEIVKHIWEKLYSMSPGDDFKHLVGIDSRIQKVKSMLKTGASDVRIVGIWGMGGIGKTTLARAIFNQFVSTNQFEGCCFLENVKETKRHELTCLQRTLFSELLKEKNLYLINLFVKDRLRCTKVLIVLDDIDDTNQLDCLFRDRDWFSSGSRIIITTRDRGVLTYIKADAIYEVEKLNLDEALKLFCLKAFRGHSPTIGYVELSQQVVSYAKGIPLALEVLGCHLCSKSINVWESALDKLKEHPNVKIHEVLKISVDGLDEDEQQIFLDIVCFFENEYEASIKRKLHIFGCHVDIGIKTLIDRSLITLTDNNIIQVHDLLRQMGQRIVREESKKLGEHSRLWLTEDILHVLKHNTGTEAIQGISLETLQIEDVLHLKPRVFKKMNNFKYLKLSIDNGENCLNFPKGLKSLPYELGYLSWNYFPLKYLPSKLNPHNLIELKMSSSKLKHLWDGVQNLANLKFLDLSFSKNLIQIPDLSRALKLEIIGLCCCTCLENLPSCFSKLESLKSLDLSYCQNINKLPELPLNIIDLFMTGTSIEQVPSSLGLLFLLRELFLYVCSRLEYLPEIPEYLIEFQIRGTGIRKLPSLMPKSLPHSLSADMLFWNMKYLCLAYTNVSEIPDWLFCLPMLQSLWLCGTAIRTIPARIKHSKLHELDIIDCKSLEYLPELPIFIDQVDARRCKSLQRILNASIDTRSISMSKTLTAFKERTWSYDKYYIEELRFDDCLKLDHNNIIFEFQIRALRLNFLQRLKEVKFVGNHIDMHNVEISFPRDEIPKWFNYQNDNGSLINIKPLPPQCYDKTNFMGFASCVVVAPELNGEVPNSKVYIGSSIVKCDVKINYGQRSHTSWQSSLELTIDSSNHVLMCYVHTTEIDLASAENISIFFSINSCTFTCKVKRCGIRMLQVQDEVDFGISISPQFELSELQSINLKKNEPPPKRTKFSSSP